MSIKLFGICPDSSLFCKNICFAFHPSVNSPENKLSDASNVSVSTHQTQKQKQKQKKANNYINIHNS